VDARSDIFSFGVVLYEMITGVRAFQGESALSTLLAILRDQTKPVAELAPGAPPQIEHLIQRCLGKKPDDRWQSMQDVRAALAALKHESDSDQLYKPRVAAAGSRKLAPGALAIGAAAVLLAGAGGVWWMTHRGTAQPVAVAPARPESIPTPVAEPAETVLSNDSIIEMVQAKVAASNVLGAIRSSKTNFDLSPAEIIRLTKSGVPASVIEAMRDAKSIPDQAVVPPNPTPAQSAPVETPQPVAAIAPAPAISRRDIPQVVAVTLTDGSPLRIELAADIPADAPEGQTIGFTTSEDFRAGDRVLIPRGASVTGAIVEAAGKKKLRFIGGSKLTFRLIDLDAGDGRRLHVRCTLKKRADGAPPSRPVENSKHRHSKEVAAAAGAAYVAYIDGDQTISIRK
jgi:serine/threonine-protein kinase